jgi:hypothetical protein
MMLDMNVALLQSSCCINLASRTANLLDLSSISSQAFRKFPICLLALGLGDSDALGGDLGDLVLASATCGAKVMTRFGKCHCRAMTP